MTDRERRRVQRHRTFKAGKIVLQHGASVMLRRNITLQKLCRKTGECGRKRAIGVISIGRFIIEDGAQP